MSLAFLLALLAQDTTPDAAVEPRLADDARLALEATWEPCRALHAFAAIDWLPFEEAVLLSRKEQRPLHLVLLFGCLDDDAC